MAASTVGHTYTHTSAQCSLASVGLAQARPNNMKAFEAVDILEFQKEVRTRA